MAFCKLANAEERVGLTFLQAFRSDGRGFMSKPPVTETPAKKGVRLLELYPSTSVTLDKAIFWTYLSLKKIVFLSSLLHTSQCPRKYHSLCTCSELANYLSLLLLLLLLPQARRASMTPRRHQGRATGRALLYITATDSPSTSRNYL